MKIYVVTKTKKDKEAFLKRNPFIDNKNTVIIENPISIFFVINSMISNENEIVLFMHDDIYFKSDLIDRTKSLIEELERKYKNWGIVGNNGVACGKYGYCANDLIRFGNDFRGGPNLSPKILPAENIDGSIMLLNIPLLKKNNIKLPNISGYKLYDLIISIETIKSNLRVLIAPMLACYHNSKGNIHEYEKFSKSKEIQNYLSTNLANKYITTPYSVININNQHGKIDIKEKAIDVNYYNSKKKTLTIVVRTQFRRLELLNRSLSTIESFIYSSKSNNIKCVIITDNKNAPDKYLKKFNVIKCKCNLDDSRFFLIKEAFKKTDSNYIWFIDDDDWIFPNKAELVEKMINISPDNSTFYLDSLAFKEEETITDGYWTGDAEIKEDIYYKAKNMFYNILGNNNIPFCSIIFPRKSLNTLLESQSLDCVKYDEDYLIQSINMLNNNIFPVFMDYIIAGISYRKTGNTITETDRTEWFNSLSTASYRILSSDKNCMLSLEDIIKGNEKKNSFIEKELNNYKFLYNEVLNSTSWKLTKPIRKILDIIKNRK